ncbi:PPK2 family polyphosphate kinase [Mariniluteicoccus flavus]
MAKKNTAKKTDDDLDLRTLLRVPQGSIDMGALDPDATPGYPGKGKDDAEDQTAAMGPELSDLQERLYANGRIEGDPDPRVLLILQGLDTSGKGGVIRHSVGLVDPQGIQLKAFKAPTAEERKHDFLWRIRKELPGPGMIGIFDRSHYEDVLVVRVDSLVAEDEWRKRYDLINEFEAEVVASGTRVIKCFLNVGHDEQKARLMERLENPEKHWKYNPGDVDSRSKWPAYMEAYAELLERCNPDAAPWFHVPANRKWYRDWAVTRLLLETLREVDPQWPGATFDVEEEKQRVEAS